VTCCLNQAHIHRVVRQDLIAMASVAGREGGSGKGGILLTKLGPRYLAYLQTAVEA
jgi:hypothetical protein